MLNLAQFQSRVDSQLLAQLTDPDGATADLLKVQAALDDAAGIIDGYLYKLPVDAQPPLSSVEAHQVALTLYALAGNRPGQEFESIAARAKVAINWLSSLAEASGASGAGATAGALTVASESSASLFDEESLAAFGDWSSDGGAS